MRILEELMADGKYALEKGEAELLKGRAVAYGDFVNVLPFVPVPVICASSKLKDLRKRLNGNRVEDKEIECRPLPEKNFYFYNLDIAKNTNALGKLEQDIIRVDGTMPIPEILEENLSSALKSYMEDYFKQGLSSGNAMDFIGNGNMYSKFWGKVNGFRESVLVGDKTEERKRYFDARRFFREFDFQEGIVGLLNYVGREPNNLGVIDCYIQLMIAYQRKDAGKMVELKGKIERLIERRV